MQNSNNIKLLALHYVISSVRHNCVIYKHESLHSFYTSNNLKSKMCYNTFVLLYKAAIEAKVMYIDVNGNRRLINRNSLIYNLNIPFFTTVTTKNNKQYTNYRYINKLMSYNTYKLFTYKQLLESLYECIAMFNFIDQKKKLNKNFLLTQSDNAKTKGKISYRKLKAMYKASLREEGETSLFGVRKQNSISTNNKEIVTGSNHLATLMQCSSSKANNILRKMAKKRIIFRKIVSKEIYNVNMYNYKETLAANKWQYIHYNKNNEFFVTLGSTIKLSSKISAYYSKVIEGCL